MMNHHHAEKALGAGLIQHLRQSLALGLPQCAGGEERQGWNAGIHADQGEWTPPAQIGKTQRCLRSFSIVPHVGREDLDHLRQGGAHVGIMIAGHDRDLFGTTEPRDLEVGCGEFRRKAHIDEISCQGDVVRVLRNDVVENRLQYIHVMDGGAGAVPVERPGEALVEQRAQRQVRQGADMRIGKMGEGEDHAGNLAGKSVSVSPLGTPPSSESLGTPVRLNARQRVMRWAFHRWFRLVRGMTMGVRAAVLDGQGRVFLVRHTYMPGWHLPGGGIEAGQSAREALEMELDEEGHIRLAGEPVLFGVYQNRHAAPRDHVLLYVVRHFVQERERLPDRELAQTGFFPLDALPAETTAATRRRLEEIAAGRVPPPHW